MELVRTDRQAKIEWTELENDVNQRAHLWRVLRERVLELALSESGYSDRDGKIIFPVGFQPFSRETDAFTLFCYWDSCVQIYKLEPKGDYLVQLVERRAPYISAVGVRAPTVRQSLFRTTVEYMAKKRIKWRVGK